MRKSNRFGNILPVIVGFCLLAVSLYYRKQCGACFSDAKMFYGQRFIDGRHSWPYSPFLAPGLKPVENGVEYPSLTGLIMWLMSFITPQRSIQELLVGSQPWINYFIVNAILSGILFLFLIALISKHIGKLSAYLIAGSPALIFATSTNFDMWAVLTTFLALLAIEKRRIFLGAFLLASAISFKFYPVLLLIPYLIRNHKIRNSKASYQLTITTIISWIAINLPFVLIDFKGWQYFYKFSMSRPLGEGSLWQIPSKLGFSMYFGSAVYYALNAIFFGILLFFTYRIADKYSVTYLAFFYVFAFLFFGKVYSMQHVLWLASLAVLSISRIKNPAEKRRAVFLYILWQISEVLINIGYYGNIQWLNDKSMGLDNTQYAYTAACRYFFATVFAFYISRVFYVQANKSKVSSIN